MTFNQRPSYEQYPSYGSYQQPEVNSGMNPIVNALSRGLIQKKLNQKGSSGNSFARAMERWSGNAGTGVATPLTGGVEAGAGIGNTAEMAGAGAGLATGVNTSLDAQAAGNVNPDFSSGGFMDKTGRAMDTGFGDTGAGGGLRVSDNGPGLQQGQNTGFGYDANANNGAGEMTLNGEPSSSSDGSYAGAVTGALAGANAGVNNYYNDPNMRNGKDGFGKHHADYRATIGGGTVGGLIGYYTDGYGNAAVPAVVEAIHPTMERFTRGLINTGDKVGDSAGAYVMDPIGTVASGKYSNEELARDKVKYSLMGGLAKFV